LEALTHAAETLMGKFRDGMPVTGGGVTLLLGPVDRIKAIFDGLGELKPEPPGGDADPISQLPEMGAAAPNRPVPPAAREPASGEPSAMQTGAETVELKAVGAIDARPASHALRVSIDTLDQLMTMVSELVLTRNQLFEVLRRHDDSEFKVPLQRLSNVTTEVQQAAMTTRMQPIGNAWQKLTR